MTNLINTGGKATRLDGIAPYGCKALTPINGRPIIEWQLDVLGEATIVCRSFHLAHLKKYGPCFADDAGVGPAGALLAAPLSDEPVTVVYADSYFEALPDGDAWVGVNPVEGGRWWDLVYSDGHCDYAPLPAGMTGRACVGLYRFPDGRRLESKARAVLAGACGPVGMAPIVNNWPGLSVVEIPSWRDVGDPQALDRFHGEEVVA